MATTFGTGPRSRREMMKSVAATAAGAFAGGGLLSAARPVAAADDPRVAKIVADAISVDMHNHMRYPFVRTPADLKPDPTVDLVGELKASGLSALCYCYCVDSNDPTGVPRPAAAGDYYKYHIQSLDYADRLLAKTGLRRALTIQDIRTAHARKQPIIIQNSEGAQFIEGKIGRVEEAYKRGLRHLQFVHQIHDLVAPLGDIQDNDPTKFNGLTPFGADVIRECERLGIVVDLAHGHPSMVLGALKVAKQPFVVSHTGLNTAIGRGTTADWLTPRLVSREHAKAVADAGGVVGVWHLYKTMKEYVAEVKEMADAIGVDHVGIGTDSPVAPPPGGGTATNKMWPDEKTGFMYAIAGEMLAQGFRADEISKIAGGNYIRVFEKATKGRA